MRKWLSLSTPSLSRLTHDLGRSQFYSTLHNSDVSLLSHAHYTLGDYEAAKSAFERGLALEPNNPNLKTGLTNAETKRASSAQSSAPSTRSAGAGAGAGAGGPGGMDWSQMANLMGGMGGTGGSGGGMPDIASLMNNPRMMEMAQQMMSNGGLEQLMQNPAIRNMVGVPLAYTSM